MKNILITIVILFICKFSIAQYTVSSNETWDGNNPPPAAAEDGITIQNGCILTIKYNMQFNPTAQITVAAGARLYINSAALESKVGQNTWKGIIVNGTSGQIQNFTNSGIIELTGRAKIADAEIGIEVNDGGIVKARKNTKFLNCDIAAKFNSYQSPSSTNVFTLFDECTFEWDEDYYSTPGSFVILNNVSRIEFQGCTFINNLDWPDNFGGTGIESTNSSFNVVKSYSSIVAPSPCIIPTGVITTFEHLTNGIDAIYNLNPTTQIREINIIQAEFINNQYGIKLDECRNLMIYDNDFKIYFRHSSGDLQAPSEVFTRGIHAVDIEEFSIEKNSFFWDKNCGTCNATLGDCYHRGISLVHSGGLSGNTSLIAYNSFGDAADECLTYSSVYISGVYSKWANSNNSNLEIKCNNFNIDEKQWLIDLELDNGSSCTLDDQGSSTIGAGNKWTNNFVTYNVQNKGTNCSYFYKSSDPAKRFNPVVSNTDGSFTTTESSSANSCTDGTSLCDVYGTSSLPRNDMTVDASGNLIGIEDLDDVPVPSARYLNGNSGDLLNLKVTNEGEMVDVYIYNSHGSLLKMEKIFIGNLSEKELKSLVNQSGLYIFRYNLDNTGTVIKKIFVVK
ncbi:MAG: hypothetical protein HN691_15690 [Bacteroidetes bacterium]|jgi:hypothetical protein|nr:hypothetical protein [Bacteroidota bacterium]